MKSIILDGAVEIAARVGFRNVTRRMAADKAGCALATVSYHWKSIPRLHTAILARAIECELLIIVAQGLAEKHPLTRKAPVKLRRAAAKYLIG